MLLLLKSAPSGWTVLPNRTAIGINASGQLCLKQSDGTITVISSSGPSSSDQDNVAGTTLVTPSQPVHSAQVNLLGTSARTAVIVLNTTDPIDSEIVDLTAVFEDAAGIVIEVRQGSAGGTLLASFTTGGDGITSAFWSFVYRVADTAFSLKQAQIPAF